ncbi:MAG: methionyl aminopeptidase [Chlamydiia bacterium]|nr:methionyl aminopeptidase [Chlamydiia bacterium]
MGRNDPCWCGSGKKWKKCHFPEEQKPQQGDLKRLYWKRYQIILKSPEQIQKIREANQVAADILNKTIEKAVAGITTDEINAFSHQLHKDAGVKPAPLGFGHPPFPKSICTSLNEVICHGIPDQTALKDGDILNIDVSVELDGYFGDCSRMVCIGNVSADSARVVDTSYHCLMDAVHVCGPGVPIREIGEAIERCARKNRCSVVYQFVGHGVGVEFHEPGPQIPHYRNNCAIQLVPGMTFTIEPMINLGVADAVIDPADQWTARTADGKCSAQWEHTLLITEDGCEILTPWEETLPYSPPKTQ